VAEMPMYAEKKIVESETAIFQVLIENQNSAGTIFPSPPVALVSNNLRGWSTSREKLKQKDKNEQKQKAEAQLQAGYNLINQLAKFLPKDSVGRNFGLECWGDFHPGKYDN
jgi:hypothetical protein